MHYAISIKCIIAAYILLCFHLKLVNSWVSINYSYQLRQLVNLTYFSKVWVLGIMFLEYLCFGWSELVKVLYFISVLINWSSGMVDRQRYREFFKVYTRYNFVFRLSTIIFFLQYNLILSYLWQTKGYQPFVKTG